MTADAHRLATALADRYAIQSEIDTGGMATVYRARDLKHERTVAIKVLRPDLAEAIGADRFLREIRTTANLSHPHILPLFDSGEADGFLYYVMPFVKGESLADRLEREGQLPVEDAVQIAREVADALAYAHRNGVIHRDIKPANVMLDEGHALLMDFGIAQARAGADETRLTGMGMSPGTPAYMSPEQISGQGNVDGRSDQYALACVLYEMLVGHPPFTAENIQTVMRQHLAAVAPKVTGARTSVPTGVAKAIHRGLAKTPADRYRTVAEFEKALAGATLPLLARIPMGRARGVLFAVAVVLVAALGAVLASLRGPGEPEIRTDLVVVLPFTNLTGDESLDDVAEIATYQINQALGLSGVVQVARHDGVTAWWDATRERRESDPEFLAPQAIAQDFRAGIVIWGEVLARGDSIELSAGFASPGSMAELQRPAPVTVARDDGDNLDTGLRTLADRLAAGLARYLDLAYGGEAGMARFWKPPPSLDAWRETKAARQAWIDGDLEAWERHNRNALALDSTYLSAKAGLAVNLQNQGRWAEADSLLQELAPHRQEMPLGQRSYYDWAVARSSGDLEGMYLAAKESAHTYPSMHWMWGVMAIRTKRPLEAVDAFTDLDPDQPLMEGLVGYWGYLATALHMLGDHSRELREVLRGRERLPDAQGLLQSELRARVALGQLREVDALIEEAARKGMDPVATIYLASGELRAHGYLEASTAMAERGLDTLMAQPPDVAGTEGHRYDLVGILYRLERWEEAYAMSSELSREHPNNAAYLSDLGLFAARTGRREEALRVSDELAAMQGPHDLGDTQLRRACIAAALGEKGEAVDLLKEAYRRGWGFGIGIHTDQELELLRGYPPYEEFMRPKG